MKAMRTYIPKLTHPDNNTRRWQHVVFIKDTKSQVLNNRVYKVQIGGTPVKVLVAEKLGDGWFKCLTQKGVSIRAK